MTRAEYVARVYVACGTCPPGCWQVAGLELRAIRQDAGLSLQQVAARFGTHHTTVQRIELRTAAPLGPKHGYSTWHAAQLAEVLWEMLNAGPKLEVLEPVDIVPAQLSGVAVPVEWIHLDDLVRQEDPDFEARLKKHFDSLANPVDTPDAGPVE